MLDNRGSKDIRGTAKCIDKTKLENIHVYTGGDRKFLLKTEAW